MKMQLFLAQLAAKKIRRGCAGLLLLLMACSGGVWATPIFYESTQLAGNEWRYDYTLGNTTATEISWFTIFFDPALYTFDVNGSGQVDQADFGAPTGWDPIVALPILTPFTASGFYDALALGAGLAAGDELAGFSIRFHWLGQGTPGSQPFTLGGAALPNVPAAFTQLRSVVAVPAPQSALLAGCAFVLMALRRRPSRKR